jgi:hypothetical protein
MITIPATLTSISATHDRCLRLGFHTNEITMEAKQELWDSHDKFGYLVFKPNEIDIADIPTEQAEDKSKTPAKRLRGVLYILHIQSGGKKEEFESFYHERMEKLIDQIKARLD